MAPETRPVGQIPPGSFWACRGWRGLAYNRRRLDRPAGKRDSPRQRSLAAVEAGSLREAAAVEELLWAQSAQKASADSEPKASLEPAEAAGVREQ